MSLHGGSELACALILTSVVNLCGEAWVRAILDDPQGRNVTPSEPTGYSVIVILDQLGRDWVDAVLKQIPETP